MEALPGQTAAHPLKTKYPISRRIAKPRRIEIGPVLTSYFPDTASITCIGASRPYKISCPTCLSRNSCLRPDESRTSSCPVRSSGVWPCTADTGIRGSRSSLFSPPRRRCRWSKGTASYCHRISTYAKGISAVGSFAAGRFPGGEEVESGRFDHWMPADLLCDISGRHEICDI